MTEAGSSTQVSMRDTEFFNSPQDNLPAYAPHRELGGQRHYRCDMVAGKIVICRVDQILEGAVLLQVLSDLASSVETPAMTIRKRRIGIHAGTPRLFPSRAICSAFTASSHPFLQERAVRPAGAGGKPEATHDQ